MQPELSPSDTQALIEYAKRKYAEERWPYATELRGIREALAKLDPKPNPVPPPTPRPYVPSSLARRKNRR